MQRTSMYGFPNVRIIDLMKSVLNYTFSVFSVFVCIYKLFSVYDSCRKRLPAGMSTSTSKAVNCTCVRCVKVVRCHLKMNLPWSKIYLYIYII